VSSSTSEASIATKELGEELDRRFLEDTDNIAALLANADGLRDAGRISVDGQMDPHVWVESQDAEEHY